MRGKMKQGCLEVLKTLRRLPYPLKFFLVFSVIFGGLIIKCVPPLQAPDEIGHYVKAESFAHFDIRPKPRTNETNKNNKKTWGEYGFKVSNEIQKMNDYANATLGKQAKYPYQTDETFETEKVFIGTGGITNYSFINYIPQVIGIWVGRIIQKPIIWQYYLARLFNLVTYITIVFLAIKMFPFSKWGAVILGLNPMALFLSASVSGDGMIMAGGFFFVSWMMNLYQSKEITNIKLFFSGILLVSLVLIKPTMIVLGLLFFMIPNNEFDIKRKIFWGVGIFLTCISFYLLWNHLMIDQQLVYRDFADPKNQVLAFLKNPGIFFSNLFGNYFFGAKGDGVVYSFVGIFGWLDTPLGWHWVVLYFITLTIGCLVSQIEGNSLQLFQRLILLITIAVYIILTFFALYQIWNKVGREDAIEGIQGRYFIPGSLLMVPLFSSKEKILIVSNKKINMILSICLLVVLTAMIITLNNRYI